MKQVPTRFDMGIIRADTIGTTNMDSATHMVSIKRAKLHPVAQPDDIVVGTVAAVLSSIIPQIWSSCGRRSTLFNAPSDAVQTLHVTGDSFMVQIEGPGISRNESYTDETTLTWSHSTEGRSILFISNTGSSDMTVKGTALISSDLIHTAYHGMVIISGIVILGFSAGFSKRKPRGF